MSASTTNASPWIARVGDRVIINDPDSFLAEVRNKVARGRQGEIVSLRDDDYAIVRFPAQGRRKEFRHAFRMHWLSPAPAAVTAAG